MTILALYSNKGGVGKTAATVNLSYLAAQAGANTLVCDLDPQSSTTFYFRVKPRVKRQARGFLRRGRSIERSIKGTDYENLDLLPADLSHRNLDITWDRVRNSRRRLARILRPLEREYDLIFLDCPPTFNIMAENIFNAADYLIVPVIPTTLSLRTYMMLLSYLKKNGYGRKQTHAFLSMVDRRKKMHQEMSATMLARPKGVFSTLIPYLSLVEKMGEHREPVPAFAPNSAAAGAYRQLWAEIEEKLL